MSTPESEEVRNERARWWRAASWARGQSFGPWGQLIEEEATEEEIIAWRAECERIEALRDRILEVGEDRAFEEHEQSRKLIAHKAYENGGA